MPDNPYAALTILVIDDDPATRLLIRGILRQIGIGTIFEADSGKAGFADALRIKPSVILCDIHMENGDGFAFLKNLRKQKDPVIAGLPVVLLTADARKDRIAFAKEHGANGFLAKPVSIAGIKSRIDAAIKVSKAG